VGARDGDEHVTSVLYPPISGFWTWDVQRNVVYGDANLGDYFGVPRAEFAHGAPLEIFLQRIDEQDRDRVRAAIRKAIVDGGPFRETYTVISASRGRRTISVAGRCIFDEKGEPALFPGWFVDVTDSPRSRHASLLTIEHHLEQARMVAKATGEELVCYMVEMALVEASDKLGRKT
jgi:PAS domain-containing protein